ncbi:MAG: hypothetical protein RSE12_08360 [Fuscovulum sp.]|nr:MAG: hypothetical protein RSE12_08360 [Fuscovulum sp.]
MIEPHFATPERLCKLDFFVEKLAGWLEDQYWVAAQRAADAYEDAR